MTKSNDDFRVEIVDILKAKGLEFHENVVVGGSRPDLLIVSPSGSTSVIEVKSWEPTLQNQNRARNLASLYQGTSDSDNAFVVLPGLFDSRPESGVISGSNFSKFIDDVILTAPNMGQKMAVKFQPRPTRIIFAAMPFSGKFDDTFVVAIQPAALQVKAEAVRVDYQQFSGDIVAEIKRLITESVAVVADLSESRPNVLYELGIADGLKKPIIQICSTLMENLPFDVRNNRTLPYTIGQSAKLKGKIVKELQVAIPWAYGDERKSE